MPVGGSVSEEELLPQFFLSRAAGDDDSYSLRFFRDLSAKVAEFAGGDGDVGFVDVDHRSGVDPGSPWSTAAWDALLSTQVFVALCSPGYYLNDRCGREWWIFAERLGRYERLTSRRAPALIPVPWSGADAARGGQADPDGGDEVRHLVRLRSLRPRYEAYVAALARQIVDTAREHRIPELDPEPDRATIPSVFDAADLRDSATQLPDPKEFAPAATQHVHFVVAAGSRAEMATVRNDLQFYGDQGRDWAPYHPALGGPLAAPARSVAAGRLFGAEIAKLDDLPGCIERARRNNEIVVLLVDAWITKLSRYRSALAIFDERDEPTVAMLAPASDTDPETSIHRGELRSDLHDTFHRNLRRGDTLVRIEIDDTEAFEADLVAVLEEAQNRIFRHGRVFRRPAEEIPAQRPILQGP
jgi:FxsC-like protein